MPKRPHDGAVSFRPRLRHSFRCAPVQGWESVLLGPGLQSVPPRGTVRRASGACTAPSTPQRGRHPAWRPGEAHRCEWRGISETLRRGNEPGVPRPASGGRSPAARQPNQDPGGTASLALADPPLSLERTVQGPGQSRPDCSKSQLVAASSASTAARAPALSPTWSQSRTPRQHRPLPGSP